MESPAPPLRHKWFPALVIAATAAWLIRHAINVGYFTAGNILVGLIAAALISAWYIVYGPPASSRRESSQSPLLGSSALPLFMLKPIYNGDMGIYSWRWRFSAARPDAQLQVDTKSTIADWQTTPHDYPGFLGGGYWPEVKDVAARPDWQAHPPQLVWRHEIGAGWSSFAIVGNYAFTQEQRGDRRARFLLSPRHRRARLDARRQGPLRSGRFPGRPRRHRPALHADDRRRQGLHAGRHRRSSIASTPAPATSFGRTTRSKKPAPTSPSGARAARRSCSTTS